MKKIIQSLIMLGLSLCLAVSIIFAWFTIVQDVNSESVGGRIIEDSKLIESINYYKVVSINTANEQTTLGVEMTSNNVFDMNEYNALLPEYTQVLIEIVLTSGSTVSEVIAKTKVNEYNYNLAESGNSLSQIIQMTQIQGVLSDNSFSYNNSSINYQQFFNIVDETSIISNSSLTLINNTSLTNVIYILFDYYVEGIEFLYSQNIGSDVLNGENNLQYVSDFLIFIIGGEAND